MRRKEREITSKERLNQIIENSKVMRIALCEKEQPYIVPVNYGYENDCFYIHSASSGKKIDMIKNNKAVAFEIEGRLELVKGDKPCRFTMHYESIIGKGKISFVENYNEKIKGLNALMRHYSEAESFSYDEEMVHRLLILKIEVETMTGKQSGFKEA